MSRRFRCGPLPLSGEQVTLSPEVSHHLLRVVQVPRGQDVVVFDGTGQEALARLVAVEDGQAIVELLEAPHDARPQRRVVLVAGLTRRPAWEHSLRMATELGVTEVRGFVAARSVAKGLHLERWVRVVESAAGQCGRADLPEVLGYPGLAEALDDLPENRFVCVPGAGTGSWTDRNAAVLVGPEGGLVDQEVQLAVDRNFKPMGLSRWTLRSDTAAAAALALLSAVSPPGSSPSQ